MNDVSSLSDAARDERDERDWRDGEGSRFEVRSSRFSEPQTPNVTRWLMPDAILLPISPITPFPLVVHRSHISRGTRHGVWPLADFFSILLMFQFVSHSAQQMRHAKRLLEGLPCPEEFRDIQDILFLSCAGDRDHLSMEEFTR